MGGGGGGRLQAKTQKRVKVTENKDETRNKSQPT